MDPYQKGYLTLFNAVTDALAAAEAQNFGQVRDLLIAGQQSCEELFLSENEF